MLQTCGSEACLHTRHDSKSGGGDTWKNRLTSETSENCLSCAGVSCGNQYGIAFDKRRLGMSFTVRYSCS